MNKKLFAMLLVSVFAFSMFAVLPAQAWVLTPSTDDHKFELYGPHVKGILIKLYADFDGEMTAMDNDQLDVEDWPLTDAWINAWEDDPRFTLVNYGGEAGYFILDLNKNNDPILPGGGPNPAYPNPVSVESFREALAWCVNRTFIVQTITLGRGLPMWTPIPTYMSGYVNHDIAPGGLLESLTYGGWTGDCDEAIALLEADGFHIGLDGLRYWDRNDNNVEDVGEHVKLIFYVRVDHPGRLAFGQQFALDLQACADIEIDLRVQPRAICSNEAMGAKNFHLYTGGWIFIGPDPDYLYDLYHSSMYWHPGKPPNYGGGQDALLDMFAEQIKFANTVEEGSTATQNFQIRFADLVWGVPLWCESGVKAFKNLPVNDPDGPRWIQFVNQMGFGVNSFWSFLNVMQECDYYPDKYITYGFMTPVIEWLNPIYAEWYWDWETIGKIYDGCAARNPYTLGPVEIPQLAKAWEVGLWTDPVTLEQKSKVRITLRPDLYWQDGVPISTADLFYTWIESVDDLLAKGLPPPWYYPTVQYFRSFYIIDPCNVEILLDVKAVWAAGWVLGSVVIPKHIWKPIVDISTPLDPVVHTPQPDPDIIGSGPYRFVEYIPGLRAVLDANKPGSVVHGKTSPGYFNYYPVHANVHIKPPFEYMQKLNIPHAPGVAPPPLLAFEAQADLYSMWLHDSLGGVLDGTKYVYVDGVLQDGFPKHVELVTLPDGTWMEDVEQIPLALTKCKHTIQLAFNITSPLMLDAEHPNPWLGKWIIVTQTVWVTIKEDIAGDWWDTWHPWKEVPAPDCKVDIKDVSTAAKAFGTKPGDLRWNSIADINGDYKVDIKDIANIAKMFGKW